MSKEPPAAGGIKIELEDYETYIPRDYLCYDENEERYVIIYYCDSTLYFIISIPEGTYRLTRFEGKDSVSNEYRDITFKLFKHKLGKKKFDTVMKKFNELVSYVESRN